MENWLSAVLMDHELVSNSQYSLHSRNMSLRPYSRGSKIQQLQELFLVEGHEASG
jgi:hypothetical protein